MDRLDGDAAAVALLGVGALLLLGAAAGLGTGNPAFVEPAVPVALLGVGAVGLGIRRLERAVPDGDPGPSQP